MTNSIKVILLFVIAISAAISSCNDDDSSCNISTWYQDADGDGLGNPDVSTSVCERPDGYVDNADDSDDTNSITSNCNSVTGISKVVCLTEAFLNQLSSSQLGTTQLSYSTATAKRWSNFPEALYGNRPGLSFGEMSSVQIAYAKALLKEISGTTENEGWDELVQTLNADDYLNVNGGGSDYGSGNYYIAILGTPSTTGLWEVLFGGHHFALSNTYDGGVLSGGTPSFRAVEPMSVFTYNGQSNQPLQQERTAFAAMLQGLSASELSTAKLSGTWTDLLCGPQKDNNFPSSYSGIKVGDLTTSQKELVMEAIKTYVLDVATDDATGILNTYQSELDNTYVAYSGTTALNTVRDYVRIDGPSVWIEYSVQNGIVLSDPHPHSVWRDKNADYGGN